MLPSVSLKKKSDFLQKLDFFEPIVFQINNFTYISERFGNLSGFLEVIFLNIYIVIDIQKNNFTTRANTQVRPYAKYFIVGADLRICPCEVIFLNVYLLVPYSQLARSKIIPH
jgi:hypothetical protein